MSTPRRPVLFCLKIKKNFGLVLFLFLVGLNHCCWAVDSSSALFSQNSPQSSTGASPQTVALPEVTPNPAPSFFSIFFRLLIALGITIGLIYVTIWGLKLIWEKQGWNIKVDEGKPIRVLNSMHLGPRKTVQVLEVGKRLLVLGVGHEEVNCLAVITEPEEIDLIKQASQNAFPHLLQRVVRKQEGAAPDSAPEKIFEDSRQVLGGYLDKLKTISKRKKNKEQDGGDAGEK
jgi:flagellar protein FliO/FliZ